MEENDEQEQSAIEQGVDKAKQAGKNKIKGAILKALMPVISWALVIIGVFFAAMLVIGLAIRIQEVFFDTNFTDIIVSISQEGLDKGAYKLVDKDFAKKKREELENQKVNNEVLGFEQKALDETMDDMIDKYIKAEVQTTYPKTEQLGNDFDGIITIKRVSSLTEENGEIGKELKYKYYDDFKAMVDSNNSDDALNWFSINPDTFELCIAKRKNVTTYEYLDGTTSTEGGGMEIHSIDYQKYVQNYSTPLNFFLALHLISQDVDFMEEFLEMVLGDGTTQPIVLTYVDSHTTTETEYIYSGSVTTTRNPGQSGGIHAIIGEVITEEQLNSLLGTTTISNSNISQYYEDANEYCKKIVNTYGGKLYVTSANTWLKSSNKEISDGGSPSSPASGEPKLVKNDSSSQSYIVENSRTGESSEVNLTRTVNIFEQINTISSGTRLTVVDVENEIDVEEFVNLIKKYPKVENNLTTAPSDLFYLLQQNEKTQKLERVMRYVLYLLTDKDYGVDKSDLEALLADETFTEYNAVGNLSEYLLQFGGAKEKYVDGKYYKMYGDGDGWPTIGSADLQWLSNHTSFEKAGKIMHNGEEKEVDNVAEYVNTYCMTKEGGPNAMYTNEEVEAMDIYIEVELVDKVGEDVQAEAYKTIVQYDLGGLNLSRQQVYPLLAIKYNFGSLPKARADERTFKQVYQDGINIEGLEEGSWEHNRYIWENWWWSLGGGYPGHVKSRDAQFETYVKGVFDFSTSDAGTPFERKYYIYYANQQLVDLAPTMESGYSVPMLPVTRDIENEEQEEEIFTTVEMTGEFTEANGDYIRGYYTSTMGRTFTILVQGRIDDDERWGVGWDGKCNRAASAIIASGYSDESPEELIEKMNANYDEEISTDKYWNLYGLKRTEYKGGYLGAEETEELIRNQLQKGGYLAVWVNSNGQGYYGTSGEQWTPDIHWMAIIDYKIEDGREWIAIADYRGADWYPINEYKDGINCYALIDEM